MTNMTQQQTQLPPVMELKNVTKRFSGATALDGINFSIHSGEVHCLLGDNGAGKSTLIKMLCGVHPQSSGELLVDGEPTEFATPRDAFVKGIGSVHQGNQGIPFMTVGRNFVLGREPTKGIPGLRRFGRRFDEHEADRLAMLEVQKMGITGISSGSQMVGVLSGGERQALAIARAAYYGARVLILDEPTSALGVKEAEIVLGIIMNARREGIAVVFITHNAHHAMLVGDRFTVLIKGRVADTFDRGDRTREEVLSLMAGGEEFEELASSAEMAWVRRPRGDDRA